MVPGMNSSCVALFRRRSKYTFDGGACGRIKDEISSKMIRRGNCKPVSGLVSTCTRASLMQIRAMEDCMCSLALRYISNSSSKVSDASKTLGAWQTLNARLHNTMRTNFSKLTSMSRSITAVDSKQTSFKKLDTGWRPFPISFEMVCSLPVPDVKYVAFLASSCSIMAIRASTSSSDLFNPSRTS